MLKKAFAVVLGLSVMGMAGSAFAQQQPDASGNNNGNNGGNNNGNNGNNNNNRGNRPGRGNFDPAQMRQRMMDDLKTQMDVKDDEWTVIQPKLDKVMTMSFESRMRGGFGFRRNRDQNGGNNNQPQDTSAVGRAQAELRSALDDKSISPDEVAKRLGALRAAKDQTKQDLVKAQQDLKELLSQRQEAVLVLNGLLD